MTMDIGKTSRFTRDERCRGKREDYEKRGKNTPGMSYPLHRFPPPDTEADCGGYNGISIPLFRSMKRETMWFHCLVRVLTDNVHGWHNLRRGCLPTRASTASCQSKVPHTGQ